ncbi:hypothetical protein HanRHA438_Chr08g0367231 [Helianthus annuus]|nr:hypothetical protein HanRHA438_Chr08g0367231 [Helianthus annuus]
MESVSPDGEDVSIASSSGFVLVPETSLESPCKLEETLNPSDIFSNTKFTHSKCVCFRGWFIVVGGSRGWM